VDECTFDPQSDVKKRGGKADESASDLIGGKNSGPQSKISFRSMAN